MSEAHALDRNGNPLRIVKGALRVVAELTETPSEACRQTDDLADRGSRVIAVAACPPGALRLAGLIGLSDPQRDDAAGLVATLHDMGVRILMVTGDSAPTAMAIARQVGIPTVCTTTDGIDALSDQGTGVFARALPEQKHALVQALQRRGHVVGMCGDGVNDAPALRQAQIGIAVFTATDVAKAAASMVMTEPGLGGIVHAVLEGRISSRRLLTYTLNMLVKKIEIVLFLAAGFALKGGTVLTPTLMVLMMLTNDFLSMSLTTDRARPSASPAVWRVRDISVVAAVLGICKLAFSTAIVAFARFRLGSGIAETQTVALLAVVLGNQALLYVLRERHRLWHSRPSGWVLATSVADVAIITTLALVGVLMAPAPPTLVVTIAAAAIVFAVLLDQIKLPLIARFAIE